MKRILLGIAIMFSSGAAIAQKVSIGVQGGLGLPSLQSKAPLGRGGDYKTSVRFTAGVLAEVKLQKFSIQPGLFVSQKGNIATSDQALIANGKPTEYEVQHTINLTYVELPVNILVRRSSKLGGLYWGAGPYAAIAVDGFTKDKRRRVNYVKTVERNTIGFGSNEGQLKKNDFGVNVLGGVRLKNNLDLNLSFSAGLNNLSNTDVKSYNRVASLKVGYFF